MTEKPQLHPERDELIAFGLGKLFPEDATKVESHLEECESCCETLLDLKDDTFVELVRNLPNHSQFAGGTNRSKQREHSTSLMK